MNNTKYEAESTEGATLVKLLVKLPCVLEAGKRISGGRFLFLLGRVHTDTSGVWSILVYRKHGEEFAAATYLELVPIASSYLKRNVEYTVERDANSTLCKKNASFKKRPRYKSLVEL